MKVLEKNYSYKPYPYKHYESIFTRFYQGFILPKKFGVDKRRVHFSTLIISNQIARETALKDLESEPYKNKDDLNADIEYFKKNEMVRRKAWHLFIKASKRAQYLRQ